MAIVSSIKGIEVTVEVDGTALKEYADPLEEDHESDSEVIRYVEAQAGKNFSILIRFTAAFKLPTEPHKEHLNTVVRRPCSYLVHGFLSCLPLRSLKCHRSAFHSS